MVGGRCCGGKCVQREWNLNQIFEKRGEVGMRPVKKGGHFQQGSSMGRGTEDADVAEFQGLLSTLPFLSPPPWSNHSVSTCSVPSTFGAWGERESSRNNLVPALHGLSNSSQEMLDVQQAKLMMIEISVVAASYWGH